MGVLAALGGCTDLSRSAFVTVKAATTHSLDRTEPTATSVSALRYYQLQAVGPDGSAVLILGNVDGAREAWYGAHQVAVFTEHGRVMQTSGLHANLDSMQLPANDPFVRGLHKLASAVEYTRMEDWSPGYRYAVPVHARLVRAGTESIDILGTQHTVLRVDEQLSAPAAHFSVTNHYWVDPQSGLVWKSIQHIAPGVTLQLTQLKPYRGNLP